jgi:type III secretion system FlhB-like substrate exporter
MRAYGLDSRLRKLEVGAAVHEPSGFKIRSLVDLVKWAELGDDIPPDLSECDDDLLRLIYESTKDYEEGGGPKTW